MRLLTALGVGIGLIAAPLGAQAADWWFIADVGESTSEYIVYVDKSSIERMSGSSVQTAWMLTVFHDDQPFDPSPYRSEKLRLRVDCGKRLAGAESRTLYSAFRELVHQERHADPQLAPMFEQSPAMTAFTFICSGGRQPARIIPVYEPYKDAEQRFWMKDKEGRIRSRP